MKVYKNLFQQIVSLENLFTAWEEFRADKRHKEDVQELEFNVEQNLFALYRELVSKKYTHKPYFGFYIRDPKVRHIHKATARDRVLHHAVFRILNPLFDRTFIPTSFSCRVGKGSHKGVMALEQMIRAESRNFTRPCFVLKCDVQKFFDSIDHQTLLAILRKKIADMDTMWLMERIIESFSTGRTTLFDRQGVPIGNLTSQLFANVYMNEFDQFVKQQLRIKHYARYTDDFVIVSTDKKELTNLLDPIQQFLGGCLKLKLHPKKISIRPCHQGIDFLGYVALPYHRLMRPKTRRRVFRKLRIRISQYRAGAISEDALSQSLQSYLGVLSHANTHQLSENLKNQFWFWLHM
ncbi:MAG: reverse transcriptase/maturase family protein [Candidatus Paceibacterota bacterium]|nr:MAG: reverse transcriptase/maturase family protein [Candidatus Paceibacterota bacterium]